MVVVGSGFAGSTATLSFLEATQNAGQVGSVALIEAGKLGTWPGARADAQVSSALPAS